MLNKKALKAGLVLLAISFADDATNEVLDEQLSSALKEKLIDLNVEVPAGSSTETLLELYTAASSSDDKFEQGEGQFDGSEHFEFTAKVGFTQPWQGGSLSAEKNEEFDCDDEKLVLHLLSNNLIKRN